MDLKVKLETFEGPLDLLLHLIEKNKMDIFDIPIVEITAQYMEYIDEMKKRDLAVMSEFLVMAATLLSIKSKMLLPAEEKEDEEEEDPRAELVQQLLEYKMYKCISFQLRDRQVDANLIYYKQPTIPEEVLAFEEPVDLDELVGDVTLGKLNAIFNDVLRRQERRVDPIRSKFGKIEKEEVNMDEKMQEIRFYAAGHKTFSFRGLLENSSTKMEVIVVFLVILEMMKSGEISIVQEHTFDDIQITSQMVA